jgi:hypothetical protein
MRAVTGDDRLVTRALETMIESLLPAEGLD